MNKIKVLLADDHALVRMGLATVLGYERDMSVVGEAADGEEAVRRAGERRPDVVVMDLMMPGADGIEATRKIRESCPDTHVLVLTSFGTSIDIARALAAGATGVQFKGNSNAELIEAIRTVARGGRSVPREVERMLADNPPPVLTPRQIEILTYVTKGFTNREIGRQLGISEDRVKQHVNALLTKIGAANRTEAVTLALQQHLLKA